MKTSQLLYGACAVIAFAASACNRPAAEREAREATRDIREATREIRVAADRAGDQIADGWLTTKIQAQYFADEDIKARYINVTSRERVVTLKGRVENENAHRQAVQIAQNTDGVKQVVDQLAIGPAQGGGAANQMESAWITTKIQAKFFADPQITGRDINVWTTNGVVTLAGRVASEAEKQHAIAIARGTEGVASVDDRLMVQPSSSAVATTGTAPATTRIDDAEITATVQSKFFVDELVKARRIDVETHQGVVTLRGEVSSESERAQALRLARTTDGVQRVEDSLTVNASLSAPTDQRGRIGEQVDDAIVTTKIQAKFFVDGLVPAGAVDVTTKDGVVLLEGTVPSEAAKQRALTIARETEGVVQVVDRLTIAKRTARR